MPLRPDSTYSANGLLVKEYLLTNHNINKINMPTFKIPNIPVGITIHNTGAINVASNTTPAEQYTRATINGNMKDVRVHYYVDDVCAWQNLPLDLSGWHAADGGGNGNRKTIAIEIIGNSKKAEDNGAKLATWLLNKYNLDIDHLFTHTYWLNKKDGKVGTIDQLNIMKNSYKTCPVYIIPHWKDFKNKVKAGLKTNSSSQNFETKPPAAMNNSSVIIDSDSKIIDAPVQIQFIDNKLNTSVDSIKQNNTILKQSEIDVYYQAYSNKRWLPVVKNLEDYAGLPNYPITCLAIRASQGKIIYRVHQVNSNWMNWVDKYDILHFDGYAGVGGIKIDGVQIKFKGIPGYDVRYRVAPINSNNYYPWVVGAEGNNFAGMQGNKIGKIQIEIVKIK